MNIGKALKLCRSARNLSLESVSEQSGISISHLSRIENQKREPTLPMVSKIAESMGVPVPVVVFLASDKAELEGLDDESRKRFSELALGLLRAG
ncbi:helix-turn-helix domain-containing protein [Achromobacter xylosoxidans]